jgi:ubiquinone/menaquinone biosynthesis C-methylase UbiE
MYNLSAEVYDAIYAANGKDYAAEAGKLHELIQQYKTSPGNTLLEVACGTAEHVRYLQKEYQIEGLDLSQEMLEAARNKFPDIPFHQGDMADFELDRRFDVVTCLFSSIGYTKTLERMRQSVLTMSQHLNPGGLLVIEPWFTPDTWHPGAAHATFVDQPDLKIARMNISEGEGRLSWFELHHLVATHEGIRYFTERHELGLFTHEEYMGAINKAGLGAHYDPDGLTGRGLYFGQKPA